ncbi:PREDICTED: tricyclene synthase, chloroplastic isoform X2 [Camelina sativa]|uniref:Tricyclene synthase, chloroplastic isoform X2 n=1 Tax=Camelina sativa TaxID=90675 RepID=A0ABM0SWK2_CAMSA|nr:PREDICTED: tricyclene synthase, chloroplastic isoform X2 [Camelina sativa]
MATLLQIGSALIYNNAVANTLPRSQYFKWTTMAKMTPDESTVVLRRSANYPPSLWDHRHLLSIKNKYATAKCVQERDLLKEKVREMLVDEKKTYLDQLELIDALQKLGVSYHFEREIENILTVSYQKHRIDVGKDLHATALQFRLFRQRGFNISEDVFDVFMGTSREFESDDINGLLSLYEASYVSTKTDTKLQKFIRPFATQKLRDFVDTQSDKDNFESCDVGLGEMVVQALDMPYHWRMRRLATRWYIDFYGKRRHNKKLVVVKFAKIDFNIVQAIHQEELKYVSSWWRETGLGDQLQFARDRIVENYFWTIGHIHEPKFGYIRRIMTKVNALITMTDDIYDIYGTIEELQLFTVAVESWDVNRLDTLPDYMKLCFRVMYNEVNSIGRDILRKKNINVITFLKKSWTDLCKAYLVEAEWYRRKYKPNLEEYMHNAWISVSIPTIYFHFYCVYSGQLSIQVLETLSQHQQNIVRCSASVVRLANDFATSQDELARGDVYKSIQCYMNETGASEEKACLYLRQMIQDLWDEMNNEKMAHHSSSLLHHDFIETVMNLTRMSQCMYQYGDGHGSPEKAKIVDRVMSLLFNPVPLD